MRIVLDTNCLLAVVPAASPYRPVFDAIRSGRVALAVTTEILDEYAEILGDFYSPKLADGVLADLMFLQGTLLVTPFYRWRLITQDPDDDKFVDCSVAAAADYLVSNDGHFNVLKKTPYPKVTLVKLEKFLSLL